MRTKRVESRQSIGHGDTDDLGRYNLQAPFGLPVGGTVAFAEVARGDCQAGTGRCRAGGVRCAPLLQKGSEGWYVLWYVSVSRMI